MKKAVFVTGGTVGSGLAIAERFAKEGYAVIITSCEESHAQTAAKDVSEKYGVYGKGYGLVIRDEQRVIDIFNDIDASGCFVETVVLNSADLGFGKDPAKDMDFFTVPVEEFQRVLETNLVWNFTIIRQAALRMREHHKGASTLTPIGDISDFEDLANAAWFLGSDESKNVTGAEIIEDGGMSSQLYPEILNGLLRSSLPEDE